MASLPKSLIKKYGISKKAWSVFRASKSRSSSSAKVTTMAKKRKNYFPSSKRSKAMAVAGAVLYGFGRRYLSNVVQTYIPNVFGQYTDNVVLGGLGLYLSNKPGLVGSIATAAYLIEGADVGSNLGAMMFNTTSVSQVYN